MSFRHSFEKHSHCRLHHASMINKAVSLVIMVAVFVGASLAPNVQSEDAVSHEYVLKAAYLFNFAKFVEWPAKAFADDQGVIKFCVLGKDPFGGALELIKDKMVNRRKVVIRRSATIGDLEGCHILFISKSEKKELARIFAYLKDSYVLTVGDTENFADRGGVINFTTVGKKLRFEINMNAAQRSGLRISSKLLKLATSVSK